jgi:zinc D-Ala-D-Ala carboxypeptidase
MRDDAVCKVLREIGFPLPQDPTGKQIDEATTDFQRAFAFWRLTADGFAGPKTERALRYARTNRGKCSPHFRFEEFESKGNTDYTIKISRALLNGLEDYRDAVGHPIRVVSAYRDPDHNRSVGGASNSQHKYGNACDLEGELTLNQMKALKRFSGIGIKQATGKVVHVDVRHVGPSNTTGGSVEDPTIWFYS